MEVLGAMIIFFSWVVTNTITQRFSTLKLSIESTQRTVRLYETLHELRSMINSLGLEVIQGLPKGINATRFRAGKHHIDEVEAIREQFCLESVSAHQVRELLDFMDQTHELAKTVGKNGETSKEVLEQLLAAQDLRDKLYALESKAEKELERSGSFESETEFKAIPDYIDFYRDKVLAKVPEFYSRVVELSNQIRNESQAALEQARLQANIANYASLALYATGSLLILVTEFGGNGS